MVHELSYYIANGMMIYFANQNASYYFIMMHSYVH